jgi:predicted amidohydrolase
VKFTIALLQILPFGADQDGNLEKGIEYCKKAKQLGADLALFPELWNIGFATCPPDEEGKLKWEASAIDRQSSFFQGFVRAARSLEINIALTYLEKYRPRPRNTVSIVDREGNVVLDYSKVFICDFGKEELLSEHPNLDAIGCDYNCTPGNTFEVCTLTGKEGKVQVGAMICADREFPEAATQLMLNGAELIVVPNSCSLDGIRSTLLKARAFDNLVGIGTANYPYPHDNGNSQAYTCVAWKGGAEQDTLMVRAGVEEGLLLAAFDVGEIREFRKQEAWRMDYRKNRRLISCL